MEMIYIGRKKVQKEAEPDIKKQKPTHIRKVSQFTTVISTEYQIIDRYFK